MTALISRMAITTVTMTAVFGEVSVWRKKKKNFWDLPDVQAASDM